MEIRLLKQPHTQQQKFIDSVVREQLYGGAKRGGKSVALCQKITLLSVFFPGNRGLLARLNLTDLIDTTLNEFWQVCPPELIVDHNKNERKITLKTIKEGVFSTIIYRGLGDAREFEKIKGLTLGWLAVDEPTEIPLEQYLMLTAQFTWQLPDGSRPPYMAMLASNPEPGWVEDRFIFEPAPNTVYIPAKPCDNPHLPPGYEDELRRNFPEDWVKKYLDGQWGASEGAVFKELDESLHNLDLFLRTEQEHLDYAWGCNIYEAIDHGSSGTTAYVVTGSDAFGNLYAFREYYKKDRLISEHAADMLGIRAVYSSHPGLSGEQAQVKQVMYSLIDPSTVARTLQGTEQLQAVADAYRENGINVIPGWNALELGLNRIKEHLKPLATHPHPFIRGKGGPSLYISKSRCPNLWKEMRSLKKKVDPFTGQVRFVGSDHALDPLRYFCNSQPRRAELAALDDKYLTNQERHAKAAHDAWVRTWQRQVQRANQGQGGQWFNGMAEVMQGGAGRVM